MKKSILALAVLGAFAGAASAQSSVTMYGRVDLSVGKPIGTAAKGMFNGSGSRLGMRGSESLGGGLNGIFNIETRFDADTGGAQNVNNVVAAPASTGTGGTATALNRFWGARSIVGLQGAFGTVTMGREYTPAFLQSQLSADPWGWDTVAAAVTSSLTGGGIAKVRNDSALTYTANFGPVNFGFQTAERTDHLVARAKRPVNVAFGANAGPVRLHLSHEVTGVTNEKWTYGGVSGKFGPAMVGLHIGSGTAANTNKHSSGMLTAAVDVGAGQIRFATGNLKAKPPVGATVNVVKSGMALGYHHSLSKRTTVYADFARNGAVATQKQGYDVGLKHNF